MTVRHAPPSRATPVEPADAGSADRPGVDRPTDESPAGSRPDGSRPDGEGAAGVGAPAGGDRRSLLGVVRVLGRDPRFWLVQVLVLVIFVGNELLTGESGTTPGGAVLDIAVEALFLVPILYAALNFGVLGSLLTGAWVTVLMVGGDLALDLGRDHLYDAESDAVMVAVLDAVAIFVGWRMAVELAAHNRYWDLFESNETPIVIVDATGVVGEANAAARQALGRRGGDLAGQSLERLVGPGAHALLAGEPAVVTPPSGPTEFRAVPTRLAGRRNDGQLQIVLQNLSDELRREHEAAAYARFVLRGQEEERQRVAQELHDGPVQRLVQVCRQLDLVDEVDDVPPDARAEVAETRDLAELVVTELREILRGLRPPALEHLGLVPTLRRLLDELAGRAGVRTELVVEGQPRRLDSETELTVFRIGQEALNNVERHAHAKAVTVMLQFGPAEVGLTVADDGAGFDPGAPAGDELSGTFGLRGMAERVQLIGGELEIRARAGEGTEVCAVIPVAGDTPPARPQPD